MIVIAGVVIGSALGVRLAFKHGGRKLDALQYAVGFAICFGLLGLFATIAADRLLLG
jgi:hypothetical protein